MPDDMLAQIALAQARIEEAISLYLTGAAETAHVINAEALRELAAALRSVKTKVIMGTAIEKADRAEAYEKGKAAERAAAERRALDETRFPRAAAGRPTVPTRIHAVRPAC